MRFFPRPLFLPLLPLGRRRRGEEGELLRRIGPPCARVFQRIDAAATGPVSQGAVPERTAVEKMKRDLPEICPWPFDPGSSFGSR